MNLSELKEALQLKTLEFEVALEAGLAHKELLAIYKQIKNLQFRIVQAQLARDMKPA